MKNLKTLLAISTILCLLSCSKDDDGGSQTPPQQKLITYKFGSSTQSYEYLDDKLYKQNTANGIGTFTYNSNKISSYNTSNFSVDFFYDATSGSLTKTVTTGSTFTETATYTYNAQNLVQEVHTIVRRNTNNKITSNVIKTFEYNTNNQLVGVNEDFRGPSSGSISDGKIDVKNIIEYYDNGNVKKVLTKERRPNSSTFTDDSSFSYTYDDKTNPFYSMVQNNLDNNNFTFFNFLPKSLYIGYNVYSRPYFYSKNNIATIDYKDNASNFTYTTTYNYVYDENNYPISADLTRTQSDGGGYTVPIVWNYE